MFIHRAAAGCELTEPLCNLLAKLGLTTSCKSDCCCSFPPEAAAACSSTPPMHSLLSVSPAWRKLSCSYVLNHSFEAAAFVCCVQESVLTILHTLPSQERACKFKLCQFTMRLQTSSYMGGIFFN